MPLLGVPYAVEVVQKVALIAILLLALSQLRFSLPWFGAARAREVRLGLIIGITLIVGMSYPLHLPSGAQVYGGAAFIGVVSFLGGPYAAAVSLILVVPYRLWLAGPYVATGATFLLLVAGLSVGYRRAVAMWSERPSYAHLPFLSLIVSVATLAALSELSPMNRTSLLRELGPSFAVGTFLAVWGLGALVLHQQRREERDDAFAETREILASITGSFPGIFYRRVLQPDGTLRYAYVSGAVTQLLGVERREILADAQAVRDRIHPEDQASVAETMRSATETLRPLTLQHRVLRRDGKMRWIRDVSRPHRLADGGVAWDGCMIDVTDGVAHEQALRDSETRTEAVLELLRDAYVAANAQDRIIGWNEAAQRLFGWSRQEALGRSLSELLPQRLRETHRRWVSRLAERGNRATVQDRHALSVVLDPDGGEIPVEYAYAVVESAQGWTFHTVLHPASAPAPERAAENSAAL